MLGMHQKGTPTSS